MANGRYDPTWNPYTEFNQRGQAWKLSPTGIPLDEMGNPVRPKPPIEPKSSFTPIPGTDQGVVTPETEVAAQDTVGETQPTSPELQPGNRKSIKEYLVDIRRLREQLRAQGVPEDQLPVPTFTNIQGGMADIQQGVITTPGPDAESEAMGIYGQQPVRSHVMPEWIAPTDDRGGTPTQMGPAHPIERMKSQISKSKAIQNIKNVSNEIDPKYPMSFAFNMVDDVAEKIYNETGSYPNAAQADAIFDNLVKQGFENQGKRIAELKKQFKGADVAALWKAVETGNWGYAADNEQNLMSQQRLGEVAEEATKAWWKAEDQNMRPLNRKTGDYFNTMDDFVQYRVQEYIEMVQGLMGVAQQGAAGGPQKKKRTTGGPQTPQYEGPPAVGNAGTGTQQGTAVGLPPQAMDELMRRTQIATQQGKPNPIVEFGNGQQWIINQQGQPEKVR